MADEINMVGVMAVKEQTLARTPHGTPSTTGGNMTNYTPFWSVGENLEHKKGSISSPYLAS